MNLKRLKIALIGLVGLFLILRLSIYIYRLPSYTIQTTGKLYTVSKKSEDVQVFDLFEGKQIAEIPIYMLSHEAVSTIDNSKIVVSNTLGSDKNLIKVIDAKNNKIANVIDAESHSRVSGIVALSEANKVAVVDLDNDNLLVINLETGRVEKQIPTKQEKSHLLVLHPQKPLAYVTNVKSGSISVIDLNLNQVVKIISCGVGRKGIAITPDGLELWITNTKLNTLTIINTVDYTITDTLPTGNESMKLKFSIDGKYCFVASANDGTVSIYDQQSKKIIKTIVLHGKTTLLEKILYHTPRPVNILMHPNGLYVFVSNSNANKIEVIDMETLNIVSTIGTGRVPDALAFVE